MVGVFLKPFVESRIEELGVIVEEIASGERQFLSDDQAVVELEKKEEEFFSLKGILVTLTSNLETLSTSDALRQEYGEKYAAVIQRLVRLSLSDSNRNGRYEIREVAGSLIKQGRIEEAFDYLESLDIDDPAL